MLISEKQHEANRQNAQHSTGPKTPEGKEAVRHNALTYGLRTRSMFLKDENVNAYTDLWDAFEAEYQPQTRTEWTYLESMVASQWLLVRNAASEQEVYARTSSLGDTQVKLLGWVYKQRAHLERSFRNAVADMKQAQKERRARETAPAREALSGIGPGIVPNPAACVCDVGERRRSSGILRPHRYRFPLALCPPGL